MKQVTPYGTGEGKKVEVEDMFDNIAPQYDKLNRILSLKIDVLWRKKLVKMIQKDAPNTILDIATGTGDLAIELAQSIPAEITGLDLSQGMLSIADHKVNKLKLSERVKLLKGDAENLPFEDNSFDSVTVSFGARNFENLEKGLREMKRVLVNGKKMYILEFSQVEGPLRPFYLFYFKNILPKIGALISKDNRAYTYLPDSVTIFPYGDQMKQILLNCGFNSVSIHKLSMGIATIYIARK